VKDKKKLRLGNGHREETVAREMKNPAVNDKLEEGQ